MPTLPCVHRQELTPQWVGHFREELSAAEELVAGIDGERKAMHDQSKEWWSLNDPNFTQRLQESTERILKLDAEYREAVVLLEYRRDVMGKVDAAWEAQRAKERRRGEHEQRKAEARLAVQQAVESRRPP